MTAFLKVTGMAVCSYVCESLDGATAQERALEVAERIQEVVRLAVEFELVDLQ